MLSELSRLERFWSMAFEAILFGIIPNTPKKPLRRSCLAWMIDASGLQSAVVAKARIWVRLRALKYLYTKCGLCLVSLFIARGLGTCNFSRNYNTKSKLN